jgi:transcriptional regulator with XRE-family HTH domain
MALRRLSLPFDGQRARTVREREGLTLDDLAQRTEDLGDRIHKSLLCRYENGEFGPNARRLKLIVTALNCTVDDLLTPTEEVRRESA